MLPSRMGAVPDGGIEGVEVARLLSDSVPVKESKEADDTFKVEGTVGEVVGVEVSRSLSDVDPVNESAWVANVRLQGRGHNPTMIEKANLPTIVGSLQHWHASVSSRLVSSMVCPTIARLPPLERSRSRRGCPLIVRGLGVEGRSRRRPMLPSRMRAQPDGCIERVEVAR